ncbi:MAG: ABC transporter substrate-binding protein [Actinomycetales bacterium]|nr:ABC transporter substrate-binding protein [Actinomycetales bacterium]
MNRTTVLKSAAVLGVASLALAACGGSSTSTESSAAPAASSAAPAPASSAPAASAAPAAVDCKIGTMLPQTGSLAFLGPPEFAGVDLAAKEIEAAGGPIKAANVLPGDSGDTTTDIASQTADSHIGAGVTAIIGAASSGVSLTVIDKITGAGVIQFSPANTSPDLSNYNDNGLYFRTAPSDLFQGAVLGQLMLDEGIDQAAILALDDSYGNGLANALDNNFTAGGGTITQKVIYNPQAAEFSAEVGKVKASKPKGIAVIGFDESVKVIQELIKQGIGPDKVPLFLVDGNLSAEAYKDLPKGIMKGVKATLPGAAAPEDFQAKLLEVNPDLTDFSYAPESYDAVNLIALAMKASGSCDGATVAAALQDVSKGGEACTDYASCAALLDQGKDINYEGVSGPVEFADNGDPSIATMGVYEYEANDKFAPKLDLFVTGEVPTA